MTGSRDRRALRQSPGGTRWYPTEPLLRVIARRQQRLTMPLLAEVSGLDRRTLERVRRRPRIRTDTADRFAVALGCHPSEIWIDWEVEDHDEYI